MAWNSELQTLCRDYLSRLRPIVSRFGLGGVVDGLIAANMDGSCVATESEVELLSRACDDERLSRVDIPKVLGKSYRQSNDDGDFDKVRKLRHVGIYSKVSALLLLSSLKSNEPSDNIF